MNESPHSLWRKLIPTQPWRRFLVVLPILIALFYAEEDWRGWRAWRQYQDEWAAKGEYFDMAGITPPPVPDAKNFALTPIVASCYSQMLDSAGHEIRPQRTNLVNRLSISYVCEFRKDMPDLPDHPMGNWTAGTLTDFRILQNYYRELAAKTNLYPIPLQPQSPPADVLLALSRFAPNIEELRQAAEFPCSRFPLEYDKDNPATILLPHLSALKNTSRVLSLRALAELQTGQSNQALADIKLFQRLTDSIRSEPFMVSHLSRIAMLQLMIQPIWEGLASHRWSESQLVALDTGLVNQDFLADYQTAMRGERGHLTVFIDYLRTHLSQCRWFFDEQDLPDIIMRWHLAPAGWFHQNQLHCVRTINDFFLPVADVQAHMVSPEKARQAGKFLENDCDRPNPFTLIESYLISSLYRVPFKFAHAQSSIDLARTAIALERYRLAHGKYPDSLAELTPKFMQTIPTDIIGGGPLHYHLTGDGQFLLYSVGWNEIDDGGAIGYKTTFNFPDLEQGDWVWRYPSH